MRLVALLLVAATAACATPLAPPVTATLPLQTPQAMVAAIRAAAGYSGEELAVQPLREPMVEDLREQAQRLEQEHRYPEAVAALEQALKLVPDDPALLQERAEAALLVGDSAGAARISHQAWQLGSKVGPLCRRQWETLRQLRLASGDGPGTVSAQAQRDACTVAGPARY
ncbi:MAG: tetratricopeptide repeat protein [Luteimonas sp.]